MLYCVLCSVLQREFQDSVLDTEMFLYLSPDWLSHVYQTVLTANIFDQSGITLEDNTALVKALQGKLLVFKDLCSILGAKQLCKLCKLIQNYRNYQVTFLEVLKRNFISFNQYLVIYYQP